LKILPFCAKVATPLPIETVTTQPSALPILVVDDDLPTQKLLEALVRRCGFPSIIASNGGEAIEALRRTELAAVILDMMMPSVGGREVLDFLEARAMHVPVIVCSAAGPAALSGFNPEIVKAVVRKPFDVDQFFAAVTSVARVRPPAPPC
jgi:CheY-like chemotaxis protein